LRAASRSDYLVGHLLAIKTVGKLGTHMITISRNWRQRSDDDISEQTSGQRKEIDYI